MTMMMMVMMKMHPPHVFAVTSMVLLWRLLVPLPPTAAGNKSAA
jgi:hypothetical protein